MHRRLLAMWPIALLVIVLLAIGFLGPVRFSNPLTPASASSAGGPSATQPDASPTPAEAPSPPATATAAIAATATSGSAARTAASSSKRMVLGYYVPYDATSWASFQAQADSLDYVDPQWVSVNACGGIGSRDDRTLIAYAAQHGVKVLPTLLTGSGWLNHRLLTEPTTTGRYLNEIVSYVEEMGYPGFDLDMENINAEDRNAYSAFVGKLADALHQAGKVLTLAIPAKTSDVRTGWAGPYDYAALGKSADLILLMTYDYSYSSGPAGSIAPQEWVDKVAAYAVSQMPPQKVLIGLAFYGYDWNKTQGGKARALQYSQAAALARQHGAQITTDAASRSATFSYSAKPGDYVPQPPSLPALQHDITVRTPAQCSAQEPPTPTPAPRPTPTPAPLEQHSVWLEDATSVAGRLDIAVRRGVGGVGAWRLGQEDPAVWPPLAAYRSGK